MIKSELLPTKDNLIDTFCENVISRNSEIVHFVRLLNSISIPYSIALDGTWGSGKTFFVKQTKMVLDAYNEYSQMNHGLTEEDKDKIMIAFEKSNIDKIDINNYVSVYFDAWEYDDDEEPLESLLYQISKDVSSVYKITPEHKYVDIASSIFDCFKGVKTKELLLALKGEDVIKGSRVNRTLRELVNDYFNNLLPEHGERLIIFIDELDRCNPQYAVKLLERIKHYFTNENITFVFSVNKEQLQYTVKQYYGNDFDAYKYLDRFFNMTVNIPKYNVDAYVSSICNNSLDDPISVATFMAKKYNMSIRTVSHYFDSLNVLLKVFIHGDYMSLDKQFAFLILMPIALGLQNVDITMFRSFINGKGKDIFIEILTDDFFDQYLSDYFGALYSDKRYLEDVYKAIFFDSEVLNHRKQFGKMYITKETKEYLLKQLTLLTRNSSYS